VFSRDCLSTREQCASRNQSVLLLNPKRDLYQFDQLPLIPLSLSHTHTHTHTRTHTHIQVHVHTHTHTSHSAIVSVPKSQTLTLARSAHTTYTLLSPHHPCEITNAHTHAIRSHVRTCARHCHLITLDQSRRYTAEMHRRFTKYVDTQSHGCVVKCKLSADRAFALIREYADLETHLIARRVADGVGVGSKGTFPTFEVYRAKVCCVCSRALRRVRTCTRQL
jgi:hypothetical protein